MSLQSSCVQGYNHARLQTLPQIPVPACVQVREVLEETGIRATFDSILLVRQAHGFAFGKSDMFVLCALKPEPGQASHGVWRRAKEMRQ